MSAIDRFRGFVRRADSLLNKTTGLGTDRDKRTATQLKDVTWMTQDELEALYHHSDMAAVIVDALVEEAMREPWDLGLGEDSDDTPEVDRAAQDIGVRQNVLEAWSIGRLYGGSALLLGVDDGQDMAEPLTPERVQALRYLHPVSRWELTPQTWDDDPRSPSFGLPTTFHVFPAAATGAERFPEVHRSRMLFFAGARTPPALRARQQGWHASVLQRPYEVLLDFGLSWAGVAHLMTDVSQAVWKIQGLHDMIASGDMDTVDKRMMLADKNRGTGKGVWLDAESEEFQRMATPLDGVHQTLQMFIQRLAGAARMPATILMGQSPAGMNATGESDIRWWYNRVESAQQNELKPKLEYVYELLMTSLGVEPPDEWGITFRPLWKASEAERAEIDLKRAQRDAVYLKNGVVQPEEVALSRFRSDPQWERVDLEAREQILRESPPGSGNEEPPEPDPDDVPPANDPNDPDDPDDPGSRGDALRQDVIEERGGQFCVIAHATGRNMGCYDTRAEAEQRLRQLRRFRE